MNSRTLNVAGSGVVKNEHLLAALRWMGSGDTGISSRQICLRAHGLPLSDPAWGYPKDPDDFGRCYRLLKCLPHIDIECMRGFNRIWDGLASKWSEMTGLFEAKDHRALYELMKTVEAPFWKDGSCRQEWVLYDAAKAWNNRK